MSSISTALILLICITVVTSAPRGESKTSLTPTIFDHGVDLPTNRPLIVAHRGSSGTLPEHTVEAYRLAVEQGADVIECDATITKDRFLICMHDYWMSKTTNVAEVYPKSRMNTYKNRKDYFTFDFTLEELSQVRKVQQDKFRDQSYNGKFGIATLENMIGVAQGAGRPVGIYIETKDPAFINSLPVIQNSNVTFEDLILDTLQRFGYTQKRSPCFLQSFSQNSLLYFANRTSLPLVLLLATKSRVSNETLAKYASYAYGIGPEKGMLISVNVENQIVNRTDLVQRAHAHGLRVHPYTFKNENQYLAWDYGQDPANEYADFFQLGVDGAFTDFPATYYNFLNYTYYSCVTTGNPVASGDPMYLADKVSLLISMLFSWMLIALLHV